MSSKRPSRRTPTETAPDTRSRILEAAWTLIRARGIASATMAEVADNAGVSRQAVYLHFTNRARLLLEMARYHDDAARISERITAALRSSSPGEALGIYVRTWCNYLPEILPLATTMVAAAPVDEAAHAALRDRMRYLRERGEVRVISRLADAGLLAEGWSVAEATDWLWSQLHPDNWRHLVEEADWNPRRYVDKLVSSLERVLIGTSTGMGQKRHRNDRRFR